MRILVSCVKGRYSLYKPKISLILSVAIATRMRETAVHILCHYPALMGKGVFTWVITSLTRRKLLPNMPQRFSAFGQACLRTACKRRSTRSSRCYRASRTPSCVQLNFLIIICLFSFMKYESKCYNCSTILSVRRVGLIWPVYNKK